MNTTSNSILFLDDDVTRGDIFLKQYPNATWVKTAQECIDILPKKEWSTIYLDHDLGGRVYVSTEDENCGTTVVKYIVNNYTPENLKVEFIIHSLNYPASVSMGQHLAAAGFMDVSYIPFGTKKNFRNSIFQEILTSTYQRMLEVKLKQEHII